MQDSRQGVAESSAHPLRTYLADFNFLTNFKDMHTNVRGDVLAGVTVAMVVLPMALAFGVASGLGASAGLWAAIAAGLVAGPLSGFAWSVGGPTGPMTIQLLAVFAMFPTADGKPDVAMAGAAVVLGGLILIGLGLFKLGGFIRYTPYSVISGFMTGLGLIYMILQIHPFFGLPSAKSIQSAVGSLPELPGLMNTDAALVGFLTLGAILAWSRFTRISWLPAPLIGLVVGVAVAAVPGLEVPMISAVPTGLPAMQVPDLDLLQRALVPAASLAGLCVFDSLLTALIVDNLTSTRHNSDRELVAQGAANVVSGLLGGLGSATNTMPCVVSVKSGAKTRLATVVMGLVLLALALGLGPLAAHVPMPALAAILLKAGYDILDLRLLPVVKALPRSDKLVFGLVVICTVAWSLLPAMALGLAIAFFRFVKDSADRYKRDLQVRADRAEQERAGLIEGLLAERDVEAAGGAPATGELANLVRERLEVVRPHGPLFFGAVSWLQQAVQEIVSKDVLLVDCSDLDSVDVSGAYALADLIEAADRQRLMVIVAGLQPTTARVLDDLHELNRVAEDCRFEVLEDALRCAVDEIANRARRHSGAHPRQDESGVSPPVAAVGASN